MVIKVEISEETWARMLTGKRVEGTLGLDKWTGKKDFNAFRRKAKKLRDELVKKLPWGWVKEVEDVYQRRQRPAAGEGDGTVQRRPGCSDGGHHRLHDD